MLKNRYKYDFDAKTILKIESEMIKKNFKKMSKILYQIFYVLKKKIVDFIELCKRILIHHFVVYYFFSLTKIKYF